ncbi:MAG: hypothetical protein V4635_03295 [Bacteroidota bacterium]
MNTITNSGKKDYALTLYCLYIVLMCASCSDFFVSVKAQVVFLALSIFMLLRKKFNWINDKTGRILFFSFVAIVVLHFVTSGVFMWGSVKFFAILISVYFLVKGYGLFFFKRLIDVIYTLSLITVPFYILQLLDHDLLRGILSPVNFSFSNQGNIGGVYVFAFNLSPASWGELYRNSGFMWEPGAFGGMLIFAIVFYFITSNFQIGKRILFLMLYALTTVSTATIFALLFFIALILITKYRKKPYIMLAYLPLLGVACFQIYSLPFMGGKIAYYTETNLDYKLSYQVGSFDEGGTSIGRFSGFMIEYDRMKNSPLIGHGWDSDYSDLGIGNEWSNPSGLSVLMGKFGLIGLLFVFICLYNLTFFKQRRSFFQRTLLAVVILVPVFSNPFQINIVFWSFVMLGMINLVKNKAPKKRFEPTVQLPSQ